MAYNHSQVEHFKQARERLITELQTQGIKNTKVLEVIYSTPRHFFVDDALFSHAYMNNSLPIGCKQTISQPYIVARMTEILLEHKPANNILEIGTGCGYQTAILAQLFTKVYSVERIEDLSKKAGKRLQDLGFDNVELYHGDGLQGLPKYAPYDGIMVTAAPETIPNALLKQLVIDSCLIIPVGRLGEQQTLTKVVRQSNHYYEQYDLGDVSFVPLCEGLS